MSAAGDDNEPDGRGATSDDVDADRQRARRAWRIAGWGSGVVGGGLALLVGVLGGTGRAGLAVLLLTGAASCAIAALYAVATLLLDEFRGHPTSRRRPIAAAVLFVAAAVLMAMVAGIGG